MSWETKNLEQLTLCVIRQGTVPLHALRFVGIITVIWSQVLLDNDKLFYT